MRIHHGVPKALANSTAKTIEDEPSSDRRDFLQVLLFGSLLALVPLLAGCGTGKIRPTPLPPNRMKGGGSRSHR